MIDYPGFDPVAIHIGPLAIRWYGLMYLVGFAGGWYLARRRAQQPQAPCRPEQVDDLLFYVALGVIVGGRVGYMLFYGWQQLVAEPLSLFRVWEGGMSFHGGLLGVIVALWLFARKLKRGFWELTDFVAPLVPVGLGAGRIGNFINGELWGAPTTLPWGMRVGCDANPVLCYRQLGLPPETALSPPLHPTPLYEATLEGLLLFLVLWLYSARPRPVMSVSALFLICYAGFRFGIEFLRLPDAHIGYLAFGWVTMGQLLSLPMFIAGLILWWLSRRRPAGLPASGPTDGAGQP
ncbi:MAG: prolipoprotein diacylglyceryl transferase [Gammaproteobacteria bacterium]|nr:MAG: prolipoprotein diacylglyceryl transferase [Gammaproteobacteria bacterium]